MAVYNSTHTGDQIDTILDHIVNLIYPVGSIYISLNDTNPGTLFGGTWTAIQGRFLIGANSTYIAGNTGGNTSHSHTTNAGTTGGTTLTIAQMPLHGHRVRLHNQAGTQATAYYYDGNTKVNSTGGSASVSWKGSTFNAAQSGAGDQAGGTDRVGGGGAHTHDQVSVGTSSVSNIPPYLAVYMWQRTA